MLLERRPETKNIAARQVEQAASLLLAPAASQ